jgi:hypothetical protein
MNLINLVYDSLKLKKSDAFCATKIGISLEKYRQLKQQITNIKSLVQDDMDGMMKDVINKRMLDIIDDDTILNNYVGELEDQLTDALNQKKERVVEFKEDLEDGTAEIKGIAFAEPKSPEEIVRILKIDTDKWKLSSYWNKQHKDYWLISAMVTQVKHEPQDLLVKVLENFNPFTQVLPEPKITDKFINPSVAVLSVQDLHFGKEGNDGVVKDFKDAITNLVLRAYHSHMLAKIIYVIGGDLLNMDTFNGSTTSGTPVDNDQRAQQAYEDAFNAMYWSINYLAEFTHELHVVYLPGNHDRLSSFHLAHALSKCFKDDRVKFDVDYAERKVVTYGNNFFAFEHGDVTKKNTPLVYATEFAKDWGSTIYRTCYTGHFHSKKTTEFVTENEHHGFSIKHLPSLCKSDYWHYHNKFTGAKRQAVMELHDKEKGKISEFVYTA